MKGMDFTLRDVERNGFYTQGCRKEWILHSGR